jgi:transcription-repair coupling factor (superfamily II helicase)
MLSIQAARASQAGHSFPEDAPWQREFESAFLFEETPDQMRAIVQTKADMEKPKPMDRLICGDVGYGKTEVAIRAAFKAVMGGRQVAVLVPTTIEDRHGGYCHWHPSARAGRRWVQRPGLGGHR